MGIESAFAAGFDEAGFRTAIKETMRMGMPPLTADRLVWRWRRQRTYATPAGQDSVSNPYAWDQDPATDVPGNPQEPDGEVIVDYAIEFSGRGSTGTGAGVFNNSSATVTLMDEDFELVKTADYCTIGENVYEIEYAAPTIGLFGVGVHQVFLRAQDES